MTTNDSHQKNVSHNDSTDTRVSVVISGLSEGQTYSFSIICMIQDELCPRDVHTITATTAYARGVNFLASLIVIQK